jgi:REP element-mobilizing transposase RayT
MSKSWEASSMNPDETFAGRNDYLRRLPREHYQGQAYVHWSMTIDDRRTGWLVPIFYYKFREILTHTAFRYAICCPIYCLMPDHMHLLWIGIRPESDQLLAARFFRKQLNPILEKLGARFQQQPHDHVLSEEQRGKSAFEDVVEYIGRNPERAKLVPENGFRQYSYTGCLVPGYPELKLWQPDFWGRFWRTYAYLTKHGLIRCDEAE